MDWDEAGHFTKAGFDYEQLGFSGPDSLTDEVFGKAREAFRGASNDRKLICHCGSANRVSAVWLAYRVLDQGIDWMTALTEAKQTGLRTTGYIEKAKAYIEKQSQ